MSISSVGSSSSSSTDQLQNSKFQLKAKDFINMMVTQLQNQDPLQPASNQELLSQMSQIGQLQSSTDLQTAITSMSLQSQIGSAGNLIGKTVQGVMDDNSVVNGVVNSVRVDGSNVSLELDNGKKLALNKVTQIAPTAADVAATTPASTAKTPAAGMVA